MLRARRKSQLVAAASIFAALYAVLGAFPVSKFVLGNGSLTASKIVAPIGGMIFGPGTGGLAVLIGDILDIYSGFLGTGPIVYAVIAADLSVVIVSGLAFIGRWKLALAVPLVTLAIYVADPISVLIVGPVPFMWLHILSFAALATVLVLSSRNRIGRLNPIFIVTLTWASLMCGQLMGTLVGQNLFVRFGTMSVQSWQHAIQLFVFPAYPVERLFYTVVSSLIAIPVWRALSQLRGKSVTASE